MFKPFKHIPFVLFIIAMLLSAGFWVYEFGKIREMEAEQQAKRVRVSLNRLSDFDAETAQSVLLTDFKQSGKGFDLSSRQIVSEYQVLVPNSTTTETPASDDFVVIAFQHRRHNETSLWKALAETQFPAFWYRPEKLPSEPDWEEVVAAMQEHYPALVDRRFAFVEYKSGLHAVAYGLLAFAAGSLLMIPAGFYWRWREYHQNLNWEQKLNEDRSTTYRNHPRAMRLVADDRYLADEVGLPVRRVDESYDIEKPAAKIPVPRIVRDTIRQFALLVGSISIGLGVALLVEYSPAVQQWLGDFQPFVVIAVACMANITFMAATKKASGHGNEKKLTRTDISYRKTGFHRYHDKVLTELGFTELGDFQLKGGQAPLIRTIYLSRNGNVLVEVGRQVEGQFFTIETVTNDGKLLETHSLAKKSEEKRDVFESHQRRSAKHEDLILALEEHDQLVAEFTNGGSVLEAQFTEERFPRFMTLA